MNDTISPQ
jgi:hypothetical protein